MIVSQLAQGGAGRGVVCVVERGVGSTQTHQELLLGVLIYSSMCCVSTATPRASKGVDGVCTWPDGEDFATRPVVEPARALLRSEKRGQDKTTPTRRSALFAISIQDRRLLPRAWLGASTDTQRVIFGKSGGGLTMELPGSSTLTRARER